MKLDSPRIQRYIRVIVGVLFCLAWAWVCTGSGAITPVYAENPAQGEPVRFAVVDFSELARRPQTLPSSRYVPYPPGDDIDTAPTSPRIAPGLLPESPNAPDAPQVASPGPVKNFDGADITDGGTIPPDTMGAVGPNHVVSALNFVVYVQDRNGNVLNSTNLLTFFSAVAPPGNFVFDPRVLYDPFNDRFILSAVADARLATSAVCLAATQTGNPTGLWNTYCFDADADDNEWADYQGMAFNKDWIVLSPNMFEIGGSDRRARLFVYEKADIFGAVATPTEFRFDAAMNNSFTMVPAVDYDNISTTIFLTRMSNDGAGQITKSTLVGFPPAMPVFTQDTATITGPTPWENSLGDFVPQSGSAELINAGDSRMHSCVIRNSSLWCTHHVGLPAGAPTRAAVQWWQLDTNPTSSAILQRNFIQDATATQTNGGRHFTYPSIAVNINNDVLIGFSQFSAFSFASAAYAFRKSSDPVNTFRDVYMYKAGEGVYFNEDNATVPRNRWGDYSHTQVDPLDDKAFWTIQEYALPPDPDDAIDNDDGNWGTRWAQILAPTEADLGVTKTDAPDPVRAGQNLTFSISVVNTGPDPALNVVLTDVLPTPTTFISLASPGGWTCVTPAVGSGGTVTCSIATLQPNQPANFTLVVRVPPGTPNGTLLTNSAVVASDTTDLNPYNNTSITTTLVITRADLTITKTDNPDPVTAGANLTYGIGVANNGPSTADNVQVLEVIPTQTTFVSLVSPSGWICSTPPVGSTGTIDCDKATMTPGESATFTVVVKVDPATPDGLDISDTTTVQSDTEDPFTPNNSSTSSTRVIARADVSVTKSDTPDPVTAGINLTYAISVTNTGPSIAKDLNVIDTLPNAVQFVSVTPPLGWICVNPATAFGGTLTCTKLDLNPATTDVISVVVFVPANTPNGTKFTNHVSVTSTQTPDPFPTNNTFTQETTVITRADLVISKTDSPDPVRRDFPLTYSISVTNNGPSDAQNVKITDVLPTLAAFVSATPSAGASCTVPAVGATGTVECTWAGATVPTGVRSVTIVVRLCSDINCAPSVDNTGTASSDTVDPNPGNNSSTVTTTLLNTSKPAIFRGPIATWFLRLNLTNGPAHFVFPFGQPGDKPLMCDWDGDGVETVGVVRGNAWLLRNSNTAGPNDIPAFQFGLPTDIPICGDWDGNGTQTPGIVRNGVWFLRNSNTGGAADIVFDYGANTDKPVVGDWDGNGTDTPGVFRDGGWFLRNSNSSGFSDIAFAFGIAGDIPISGDWNGDNVDTIGIVRGNVWYLRDSNTTGIAEIVFAYGALGDIPLVWK